MLEDKTHLAINGTELVMLVASDEDGNKSILWHGPETINSTHVVNTSTNEHSVITAVYTPDSIDYVATLQIDDQTVTDTIGRDEMFGEEQWISGDKYTTPIGRSKLSSKHLYKIENGGKYALKGNVKALVYDDTIDFLYYSGNQFIKGSTKLTENTLPTYQKPNVEIEWTDGDSIDHTNEYITNDMKWPLVVKYDPSTIQNYNNGEMWACWYLKQGGTNYLEFDKIGNYCEKNVAQLQFGSEYGKNAEQTLVNNLSNSSSNVSNPWHFHFGSNLFVVDEGRISSTYISQLMLRCHTYCVFSYTNNYHISFYGGSPYADVLLHYKDKDGNEAYTNIWNANPNEVYNMYIRLYGTGTASTDIKKDISVKSVNLTLKNTPTKLQGIKIVKDCEPHLKLNGSYYTSRYYVMSYEMANDIWYLDVDTTDANYGKPRPENEVTNKFNEYVVPNWFDEDLWVGQDIDNTKWFSFDENVTYYSLYDMIKGIFTVGSINTYDYLTYPMDTYKDGTSTNVPFYGFAYCEKVDNAIMDSSNLMGFSGSGFVVSSICVDDTVEEKRILDTQLSSVYKCKLVGNKYVPDVDNISDGAKIGNEIITYDGNLYVYSDFTGENIPVTGCIHCLLDSNVKYLNLDGANVFATRTTSSPKIYYGEVDKANNKISYKECDATDEYAWKYKIKT